MYNVLIADDEMIMRESLTEMVDWGSLNCRVVCSAGNGAEAWEYIRKNPVDIAILDIRMPGISGMELCNLMCEEGLNTQIIILTAYSDYNLMRNALQMHVCDYVMKSSFEAELPDAIRRALARLNAAAQPGGAKEDVLQPDPRYSEPVNQVIAYLRLNYSKHISVKEIAGMVYLNQNYLCRLYKSQTGRTIIQDLTKYRLSKAKQLLERGATVQQAAVECGFENAAYFTQVFYKNEGVNPGSYRKNRTKEK